MMMEKRRMTFRFHPQGGPPTIKMEPEQRESVDGKVKREQPVIEMDKQMDEKSSPSQVSAAAWKWGEGKEERVEWGKPYSRKGLPDKKTVGSIVLSVVGAILLGTLMGFLVLSLFFSSDSEPSTRSIDSHLQSGSGDSRPSGEEEQAESATIQLPALSSVMIQGGTYQEKSGAEEAVRQIRGEGWAAVMTVDSPHRLLLGVGIDPANAKALSQFYKENQQTVIEKEHQVKETAIPVTDNDQAFMEKQVLPIAQEGLQIFTKMVQQTSQGLTAGDRTLEPVWDEVESSSEKIVAWSEGVEEKLPENARTPFNQMLQALDQVVQSGQANVNSPEEAMLWQIQEGLIRYALAYEKFVAALQ